MISPVALCGASVLEFVRLAHVSADWEIAVQLLARPIEEPEQFSPGPRPQQVPAENRYCDRQPKSPCQELQLNNTQVLQRENEHRDEHESSDDEFHDPHGDLRDLALQAMCRSMPRPLVASSSSNMMHSASF